MLVYAYLPFVFVLGTVLGSFLNVRVARLPLEKSVLWPSSRCGHCLQPIRWFDNLPLLSYLWLRGRCRLCGTRFSFRYFALELLTGLGFVGLFYLEVIANVHQWDLLKKAQVQLARGEVPGPAWVLFGFHALLFTLLLGAAACDLHCREIPLGLTIPGTLLGLLGATLWPWPWPCSYEEAVRLIPPNQAWWLILPQQGPKTGLMPWPVWGPPPTWLPEPGTWAFGLVTGLAGALAGSIMVRLIGWLFGASLGKEAMGLGDADLMMMAGAFLGWQLVVVAFFVAVLPGLLFGLATLVKGGDNSLPFAPALAVGVLLTMLGWERWFRRPLQWVFFWDTLLLSLAVLAALFLVMTGLLLRVTRRK